MRHFFWRYQSCCPKCIGVDTEKGNNRDIEEFDSVLTRLENRSVHFHNQKWINSQKILKKDQKTLPDSCLENHGRILVPLKPLTYFI